MNQDGVNFRFVGNPGGIGRAGELLSKGVGLTRTAKGRYA